MITTLTAYARDSHESYEGLRSQTCTISHICAFVYILLHSCIVVHMRVPILNRKAELLNREICKFLSTNVTKFTFLSQSNILP